MIGLCVAAPFLLVLVLAALRAHDTRRSDDTVRRWGARRHAAYLAER